MTRVLVTLMACAAIGAPSALAEPVDECGHVIPAFDCYIFQPLTPPYHPGYVIDITSPPDSLTWTAVRIVGNVIECERLCGGLVLTPCVVDYVLSDCPDSLSALQSTTWGTLKSTCSNASAPTP